MLYRVEHCKLFLITLMALLDVMLQFHVILYIIQLLLYTFYIFCILVLF